MDTHLLNPQSEHAWRPLANPVYPWARTIERIVATLRIPRLDGPVVYISSDYGGAHKSSLYETFTVLYLDVPASTEWVTRRSRIRERFLPDRRRLSFKSLNDRIRQDALVPFLDAANRIAGVAITVAIRKTIDNLCTTEEFFRYTTQQLDFDVGWKLSSFERSVRIVHLMAMLIGGLSRPNQSIYWISDQDELFANDRRTRDLKKLMDRFSSGYVSHSLGEVGMGTTAIDEDDRIDEDLNAIPDLMSGAVAETATALANEFGGAIPANLTLQFKGYLSPKADLIYSWIADNVYSLQRAVIVFEKRRSGGLAVFRLGMDQ